MEVYLIPKKNKYLDHIKNHKLQSKTYLLSKVKIPEYVFNRFNKDIKNAFILGYILIVYYTLFNLSYIIIQIVVIITQKINVIDEQTILLILPFLASILGIKGIVTLFKNNIQIKSQVKQWNKENKDVLVDQTIQEPENYPEFKNIVLSLDFDIKLTWNRNLQKVFAITKLSKVKNLFNKDGQLDKVEFIYFLLLDYPEIKINNVAYDPQCYVNLIKDIINNEIQ
ncbi:hypothetical protein KQ874_01815 [Mycoplasma sp. ES3157-GEN-MYC]|uniref:Uncharacterized protein n=1 Tax=Mycoplasma miroungigenitalium TaxID=754515 RepID=A0A6M4JB90_9MOLU|nr:hypothetical protein [Mycoplasma miroungigenitalium]MBU4690425.1 hypothetical protein [Mycoplasma miroungigenitalium]QJR43518.1 hypothetical protein HLA87_01810 [Mycoplasma miroungigenitalium]